MVMHRVLVTVLFLLSLSLVFKTVEAQSSGTFRLDQIAQTLSVSILPEFSTPQTPTTISIESYEYNLDASSITWYIDGKVVKKGIGEKTLTFTTGLVGQTQKVSAIIAPPGKTPFTRDFFFTPSNLTLLWQAQSYVPPFYKGKSLFPRRGDALIVAAAYFVDRTGKTIPPESLIYTWKQEGTVLPAYSGYGKKSGVFSGSLFGSKETISVLVSTKDGSLQNEASLVLDPVDTEIIFFEDHPRYGLQYQRALEGSFELNAKESKIVAMPFFFGAQHNTLNTLQFDWTLNGNPVQGSVNGNSITLGNENNQSGISNLGLTVVHKQYTLQNSQKSISINFKGQ